MTIEWTTVITSIIAIVSVEAVLKAIDHFRYKSQNKKLKDEDVTGSELDNETKRIDNEAKKLDNDQKQIDIGTLFLEKVQVAASVVEQASMKMGEWNQRLSVIEDNQKRMESNQNHMMRQFEGLTTEVAGLRDELAEVKVEQNMERTFLNGTYEKERQRMLEEAKQTKMQASTCSPTLLVNLESKTQKPNTNGSKTKKNPVPRKRGWNQNKTRSQSPVQ